MSNIRLISLCVFTRGAQILVVDGLDPVTKEAFCRPLGGGIEFGERAEDAASREIREELGEDVARLDLLGVLENIFTFRGLRQHEVVFVFDSEFVRKELYEHRQIPIIEPGWASHSRWHDLAAGSTLPLYPAGLGRLLERKA